MLEHAAKFIALFEQRQHMLAGLEKMYREASKTDSDKDTITLMLYTQWIQNHRNWLSERQEVYTKLKGLSNG